MENAQQNETKNEVGFVTKKALATFHPPIALPFGGAVIMCGAAFVEYDETITKGSSYLDAPKVIRVLGLDGGRKVDKSINVTITGYGHIISLAEVD